MGTTVICINKPEAESEIEGFAYLLSLNFKQIQEDKEKIELTVPDGWKVEQESDKIAILKDNNGNTRGSVMHGYFYLRTRYSVVLKKMECDDCVETEHLCIIDAKNNMVIKDYGCVEPFSDEHYILQQIAHQHLEMVFPNWENPTSHWNN